MLHVSEEPRQTVEPESGSVALGVSGMPPLAWFPVSYALHLGEESWGGESFPVWASRMSGVAFSREEFVALNSVAFAVMCIAVAAASRWPSTRRVVMPALGTIVGGNGALHLVASLWTLTYSPGVLSGAMVWLPLGAWALRWAVRNSSARQVLTGCAAGALAHGAVSAVAFFH